MMPLGDDNSLRRSAPVVNYTLIGLNLLMFLLQIQGGEAFLMKWSFIPASFLQDKTGEWPTLFTAMFMHGGGMHLLGNMLYLWIFGDNVEDYFGKVKYLIFYLICGVIASFAQMAMTPNSSVPNVGASGAIAGVLGAYIVLYPSSKVQVLVGRTVALMPSFIVIGIWFLIQFMGGVSANYEADMGGVAYMAHVGGFVAGFILAYLFKRRAPL